MTLERLKALLGEATDGPWRACNGGVRTTWTVPDRIRKDGQPYKNAKQVPVFVLNDFGVLFRGLGGADPTPSDQNLIDWSLTATLRNAGPALVAVAEAADVYVKAERGTYEHTRCLDDIQQDLIDALSTLSTALEARDDRPE